MSTATPSNNNDLKSEEMKEGEIIQSEKTYIKKKLKKKREEQSIPAGANRGF